MNGIISFIGVCTLAIAGALLTLGEVALAQTEPGQTLARDGVSIAFNLQPLASDGKLREGEFADVQFRVTDGVSGQPLSGVAPGAWIDAQALAADQAQGRDQSCKSRVGVYLKSNIGARPLLDLNSYFLLVMNRDARRSGRSSIGGGNHEPWRASNQHRRGLVTPKTTNACSSRAAAGECGGITAKNSKSRFDRRKPPCWWRCTHDACWGWQHAPTKNPASLYDPKA